MIKKSEWLTVGKSVENFHYYFASGNPHNLETTSNESVLVFADKNKIYDADDFIEKHNLYMIKDALEYRRRELKIEAIEAEYPIEDIHLLSAIGDAIFCANIEIISEYTDKNSPIEKIFLNGLILIQYMRRLCPSIIVLPAPVKLAMHSSSNMLSVARGSRCLPQNIFVATGYRP